MRAKSDGLRQAKVEVRAMTTQERSPDMRIEGKCHCGNITYVLHWPGAGTKIPVRACSCSFSTKHGGTYTSHRDAELAAVVHDEALVSQYRFGTKTAEFYLCSRCGVLIDGPITVPRQPP